MARRSIKNRMNEDGEVNVNFGSEDMEFYSPEDVIPERDSDGESEGIDEGPERTKEPPKIDEVVADPMAVSSSEEAVAKRTVRVRLKKPFETFIGHKKWYFEEAGKIYNVPENVKFVLSRADLLDVL